MMWERIGKDEGWHEEKEEGEEKEKWCVVHRYIDASHIKEEEGKETSDTKDQRQRTRNDVSSLHITGSAFVVVFLKEITKIDLI